VSWRLINLLSFSGRRVRRGRCCLGNRSRCRLSPDGVDGLLRVAARIENGFHLSNVEMAKNDETTKLRVD
jgi:hypothetical protein